MSLSFNPSKVDRRFTAEEEAELQMWSRSHEIEKNHRKYPSEEDDEEDPLSVQARLNALSGGEGDSGHPTDRQHVSQVLPSGFDDAADDVRDEIEPLTVDELKAELDEVKKRNPEFDYDRSAKKDELRDLLAVEWSRVSA